MKFKLKNNFMKQLIKEEAKNLKKELMESKKDSRLDEIASRRKKIKNSISEIYEKNELDELFGMGTFSKAKKAYKAKYEQEIANLTKAYKSKDLSYVDMSKSLVQKLGTDIPALAKQFGIEDPSDRKALNKTILDLVQPMTYDTFKAQVQGGVSMKDISRGTTKGRN